MAYQTMMASSARATAADMANAGPPLAAGRNARGRTASLIGSASGGSYAPFADLPIAGKHYVVLADLALVAGDLHGALF